MSNVFHGWRRKFGLVTLVMALVFMGGWIRSRVVGEELTVRTVKRAHFLASYDGWLRWECYTLVPGIESSDFAAIARCRTQWLVDDPKTYQYGGLWRDRMDWWIDRYGFQLGNTNIDTVISANNQPILIPVFALIIPYVYVTILLTLLSVYLLLTKPRTSAPKNVVENLTVEGT